ncbi:MAG: DEAD/DEAH box helicase [Actinobacteria bacterium]|nr:DEAD/DEAH box helicase [Actinomycetota bacterium]
MAGSLDLFAAPTRAWFASAFAAPTPAQEQGWAAIGAGGHTLIHAPTGSGKTLAAFLWGLDRLFSEPAPPERQRLRLLYVSPLKALAYDIERNLRAPLTGIANAAAAAGVEVAAPATAMRTGDTPAADRRRMQRHPPDVLITTPESLYLILTSAAREILAPVRWVVVDEIHSVAGTKRGAHLALSLERLEEVAAAPPQRIGLSATQRPLDEIARFLGGAEVAGGTRSPRPVTVVDAPRDKALDVEVVVPVEDLTRPDVGAPADGDEPPRRSIWPAMYPELLEQVMAHRSTIVFSNSRSLVERIAAELNALAGEEVAKAHHGSVSREQRVAIEDDLKRGDLRCVVATSSLELGVDMEAVDLVVLVESPTSVARGLQRVGRAGHQVGAPSKAKVFPKHRGDLLEAALVVDRMQDGLVEATRIPANPLDVLAQQVVAAVSQDDWEVDALYDMVRRAANYADLGRGPFEAVLDMLSGRYPSDEFAELRPRLVWDRVAGTLSARPNARLLAVTNPGTIPDRGLFTVTLPEGGRVGELDEEMVYESRVGDVFVLGSTTWRIDEIGHDRVIVTPAPGRPAARMPFWHGDRLGRPLETGRALGAFIREIGALPPADARERLETVYRLERRAAANLVQYLEDERQATGALPTDRTVVVERFRDEIGDWRMVLLSPFGARVHAPWAMAAARRIRDEHGMEADAVWSDDGIILRFPDADETPPPQVLALEPDEVEPLVVDEVGATALFASRFREAAGRSLLLPRRRPGRRTPLWLQRRKAAGLLEVARRHPGFPIVLEAYREVLQEHFDLPALREVLGDISARRIRLTTVDLPASSPFASSLTFDFIASFMYEYDAPPAERRAMALTIDRDLLRDLLGEPELRELLSPDVIAEVELELQHLAPERAARGVDGLHDLLRDLGPLDRPGLAARTDDPSALDEALEALEQGHRVMRIGAGDGLRWAAVEDAGRLRDALGIPPPRGVPDAFLDSPADPLGDVVGRFARTHTPFTAGEAAASLGLPPAVVDGALSSLERAGRVSRGAFRPGGAGREWVDAGVLRRLRRRSLARLRSEVEPADPAAFARFGVSWHGIGDGGGSTDDLLRAVRRLQGAALPASTLESSALAARLDYAPAMLDALAAAGEVVWVGRGPLGAGDGRVALYLRDHAATLAWPLDVDRPDGPLHDALRTHLERRGASFFGDLYEAAGGGDPDAVVDALWDLVWAGEVTNDTLAPLRARLTGRNRRTAGRPALPSSSAPPAASGRWGLVEGLPGRADPTAAAAARAEQLLERHGIVVRDAVLSEAIPGGFAGLYPVFGAMEEAGRVRRGYFVEGLGGSQFALAGAVERLRAPADPGPAVVLGATDPANPYGAALPWPERDRARPSRTAGALVVLDGGRLAAFVERGGRRVATFDGASPEPVAAALAAALQRGGARGRRHTIAAIDGAPARETPLGRALLDAGFVESYKGLTTR